MDTQTQVLLSVMLEAAAQMLWIITEAKLDPS